MEKINEDKEKTDLINQNIIIEKKCNNLFYYDVNNNEINCLSIYEKICPIDYPYKNINSKQCNKYPLKYNGNWVNTIPNGSCIDSNFPTLDVCIDTNETLNEIGGFCIYNKTNIISNIKYISENKNNKIELCEGVTFFFYSNKDDINELSQKYKNLTFIDLGKCSNDLIKYYNYPDKYKILYFRNRFSK